MIPRFLQDMSDDDIDEYCRRCEEEEIARLTDVPDDMGWPDAPAGEPNA